MSDAKFVCMNFRERPNITKSRYFQPVTSAQRICCQCPIRHDLNMAMKLISFCKFQEIDMVNIRIDDETY